MSTGKSAPPAVSVSSARSLRRDGITTVALVVFCQSFPALTFGGIALFLPLIRADLHMSFAQAGMLSAEVLGQRIAGMSTGFSNLFANVGALTFAYSLGVVKDQAGAFTWGFVGISAACVIGVLLAWVLARVRKRALARPDRETLA